jgi:hypothetical protein
MSNHLWLLTVAVHDNFPPLVLIQKVCSCNTICHHLGAQCMNEEGFQVTEESSYMEAWRGTRRIIETKEKQKSLSE